MLSRAKTLTPPIPRHFGRALRTPGALAHAVSLRRGHASKAPAGLRARRASNSLTVAGAARRRRRADDSQVVRQVAGEVERRQHRRPARVAALRRRRLPRSARAAHAPSRTSRSTMNALSRAGALRAQESLVINYGPALLDRALLDALCRALDVSFATAVLANVPASTRRSLPTSRVSISTHFSRRSNRGNTTLPRGTRSGCSTRSTATTIIRCAQYGLAGNRSTQVIARYGNRYFKFKLGGDADADIARLGRIAAVLDRSAGVRRHARRQRAVCGHRATSTSSGDASAQHLPLARLAAAPALSRAAAAARVGRLERRCRRCRTLVPLLIDESDATARRFPGGADARLRRAFRARAARDSTSRCSTPPAVRAGMRAQGNGATSSPART